LVFSFSLFSFLYFQDAGTAWKDRALGPHASCTSVKDASRASEALQNILVTSSTIQSETGRRCLIEKYFFLEKYLETFRHFIYENNYDEGKPISK
jgi:hypothetical protein